MTPIRRHGRPVDHGLSARLHRRDDGAPRCDERGCARFCAGREETVGLGIVGDVPMPLEYCDDAPQLREDPSVVARIGETDGRALNLDENAGYGAVRILAIDSAAI